MKVKKVSATEARNNFFELMNMVMYGDWEIKIYKYGKLAVKMIKPEENET